MDEQIRKELDRAWLEIQKVRNDVELVKKLLLAYIDSPSTPVAMGLPALFVFKQDVPGGKRYV